MLELSTEIYESSFNPLEIFHRHLYDLEAAFFAKLSKMLEEDPDEELEVE